MFGQRSGKQGNYAYSVARVKAKRGKLIGSEGYANMLMMSVPDISRFISENGYQKEMIEMAGKTEGIDLLEHATYKNMATVFRGIYESAAGELKDMVSAYLEKWDIWNLKVVLRGKSYGVDKDSIREDFVPAARLDQSDLEKLLALDSTGDIITAYRRKMGISIPNEVATAHETDGNFAKLEDHLDKAHYDKLLLSVDPTSRPARLFQEFIRKEIDIVNVETILKLKAEGIFGEIVEEYIIPGGKQISRKLATQLANAETIEAAVADMTQLDFYNAIKDVPIGETNTLRSIVAGIRKYQKGEAETFSHLYPLSVIPILDFMIQKEIEVSNIRIVARGIESGLDREIIRGLLVM